MASFKEQAIIQYTDSSTRVIQVLITLIKVLITLINVIKQHNILFRIYLISNLIILIFLNVSSLKESFNWLIDFVGV